MSALDDARKSRGKVFDALRHTHELNNRAWYQAEDKRAFASEHIQTMQAALRDVQKEIDEYEGKRAQC